MLTSTRHRRFARTSALAASLCLLGLAACGQREPARPPQVVGEFVGLMDPQSGQLLVKMVPEGSPAPLDHALVGRLLASEVPTGAGDGTVTLATVANTLSSTQGTVNMDPTGNASGRATGCGKPNSYCGDVRLTSNFTSAELHNVTVELFNVTPTFEGFSSTAPGNVGGLWAYPALQEVGRSANGNSATRTWRFNQPGAAGFAFRGRVMADVVLLADTTGTPSAATGACGGVQTALNTISNCGECGLACPGSSTCAWPTAADVTSACTCDTGLTFCDSTSRAGYTTRRCVDLQSDASSCGACGNVCGASTPKCLAGLCVAQATGRKILVIAPQPGNETLLAAGRIRAAVLAGDQVTVAVITNGDADGRGWTTPALTAVEVGQERRGQVLSAMANLGVAARNVVFLGYGELTLRTFGIDYPGRFTANDWVLVAGQHGGPNGVGITATYGDRGLGGLDYHTYLHGSSAEYRRPNLVADLQSLIANVGPDEIYTTGSFDTQSDHAVTGLLVSEAVRNSQAAGVTPAVKLYQGALFDPDYTMGHSNWPCANPFATPVYPDPGLGTTYDLDPPHIATRTVLWSDRVLFPVPASMISADLVGAPANNLKSQTINLFAPYGVDDHGRCFARADELFWLTDFGANLAFRASVTASSDYGYPPLGTIAAYRAVDGVVDGARLYDGLQTDPLTSWDVWTEWVAGSVPNALTTPPTPWIKLDWGATPVTITSIRLHDRPYGSNRVTGGTLIFSDDTTLPVGPLDDVGKATVLAIPGGKQTTSLTFQIDSATSTDVNQPTPGLAEIEVFGN